MWVYSPMDNTANLRWNKKDYPVKAKNISEIPEAVAQAYFLYGLPDEGPSFDALMKVALQRWGMALKDKPPEKSFMLQFIVSETREEIEELVRDKLIELPKRPVGRPKKEEGEVVS